MGQKQMYITQDILIMVLNYCDLLYYLYTFLKELIIYIHEASLFL